MIYPAGTKIYQKGTTANFKPEQPLKPFGEIVEVIPARWISNVEYQVATLNGNVKMSGLELHSKYVRHSKTMFEFRFARDGDDVIDNKGKVSSYSNVSVISVNESKAREKSKLSDQYHLISVSMLGNDWN